MKYNRERERERERERDSSGQHSKVLYHWGIRRRRDRKTRKSSSEEKVVSFRPASLFPARKQEVVTKSGTMEPRG